MKKLIALIASFLRALSPKEEILVVKKGMKEGWQRKEKAEEKVIFVVNEEETEKREYCRAAPLLNVRSSPYVSADTKIGWLAYGESVFVLREREGWKEIVYGGANAWVSAEYLTPDEKEVFPVFVLGERNLHRSPSATKIRSYLNDEFGGEAGGLDLQSTEYVAYRVKRLGSDIIWPSERPRNGGLWADIFRRHDLYEELEVPQKHAVMCFRGGLGSRAINDIGHVAFIESVFPDGSVRISEANWPREGIYNERVIPQKDREGKYKAEFVSFL
ncbi:MAG: CHAP domain-containing protein [Candidatus Paceibacterota bacterium]